MTILVIAWHDLQRMFRVRAWYFWIFVGPLLVTSFFGVLMKPQGPRGTTVELVNHDEGDYVARALTEALLRDKITISPAATAPDEREGYTVEVPPGTARELAAGRPVHLTLRTPDDEETNAERRLRFKIEKSLWMVYLQANPADVRPDATGEQIRGRFDAARALGVSPRHLDIERHELTAGFQRAVPSYLVMFVFLNVLIAGAGLAEERASGQLKRLFLAPVTKTQIVLGKLLGRVAVGWIQMAYILLLGVFLFNIHWAAHAWVFFGFLTLFAISVAAMGMALGTLFRDPDKCRTAAVWSAILLSPLGGLWWPLEAVGSTMRTIGTLVPTGWAMEAVNGMLAFGTGAREVAPFAAALAGLAVVSLAFAAKRLTP